MRHLACLVVLLSGCTLFFDGDDEPPICPEYYARVDADPAIAPAPLRDPSDLTCDTYGPPPCDDRCGPCPAYDADQAPVPTYNYCGHTCDSLGEGACTTNPECRVAKQVDCVIGELDCLTDFLGCFPTDTLPDSSVDCWNADAWTCSRSNGCTALHENCGSAADCPRAFALCVPEGQSPGQCGGAIACDRAAPSCPPNSVPGVENACYTGACIPVEYCGVTTQ